MKDPLLWLYHRRRTVTWVLIVALALMGLLNLCIGVWVSWPWLPVNWTVSLLCGWQIGKLYRSIS